MKMDDSLIQRVVTMVNYTKSLETRIQKLQKPQDTSPFIYQMKIPLAFPTFNYLRLTSENVKVNDIIHCKSGGDTIFCQVTKINPTGINVDDLEMKMIKNHIGFHRITKVNTPHNGSLGYTRKIFILNRTELTPLIST